MLVMTSISLSGNLKYKVEVNLSSSFLSASANIIVCFLFFFAGDFETEDEPVSSTIAAVRPGNDRDQYISDSEDGGLLRSETSVGPKSKGNECTANIYTFETVH
jgi:hypothetical protein